MSILFLRLYRHFLVIKPWNHDINLQVLEKYYDFRQGLVFYLVVKAEEHVVGSNKVRIKLLSLLDFFII